MIGVPLFATHPQVEAGSSLADVLNFFQQDWVENVLCALPSLSLNFFEVERSDFFVEFDRIAKRLTSLPILKIHFFALQFKINFSVVP